MFPSVRDGELSWRHDIARVDGETIHLRFKYFSMVVVMVMVVMVVSRPRKLSKSDVAVTSE